MKINKNDLNTIVKLVKKGASFKDISNISGLSRHYIENIMSALNDEKSDIYNPELYAEIKNKQKENIHNETIEVLKSYKNKMQESKENQYHNIAIGIANRQMTVLEASEILKTSVHDVLAILKKVEDEDLKEKLRPIILQYGKIDNQDKSQSKLSSLTSQTKKEIILMALTYRVSKVNLCCLFNTSMEDVEKLWDEFYDFNEPLHYLNIETINESKKIAEYAYKLALKYWKTRNEYVRILKKAKNNNDQVKANYMKAKLKELQSEIDDSFINDIAVNRDSLTDKQIEAIARFRLKYNLTLRKCENILKKQGDVITNCCNLYAEKNPIYAIKLARLIENNSLKSSKYYAEMSRINEYHSDIEKLKR